MVRILFVCLGNICRSTMAEFVFRDMAEKRGLGAQCTIASAGTSSEECGNPVHPGTRTKLAEHGISCKGKTAVQLTKQDYAQYDLLIGMEAANIRSMLNILGGDPEGKVHRLLHFASDERDIADPWFSGDFEATWQDVNEGCEGLMASLQQAGKLRKR